MNFHARGQRDRGGGGGGGRRYSFDGGGGSSGGAGAAKAGSDWEKLVRSEHSHMFKSIRYEGFEALEKPRLLPNLCVFCVA
jgi:hypothetical protein